MPMFYVPLTGLAMASVDEAETASASGLMNFVRTISGAFATSLVTTAWEDKARYAHAELAGVVDPAGELARGMASPGFHVEAGRELLDGMVTGQSLMLATNELMVVLGLVFAVAAALVFLTPKPGRVVVAAVGH